MDLITSLLQQIDVCIIAADGCVLSVCSGSERLLPAAMPERRDVCRHVPELPL